MSSSGAWEYKTITFTGDTSGALNNDNGAGFYVLWHLGAGSNFTSGTLGTSWQAQDDTDRVSSSNVNLADTIGNYFQLTGIQLEVGDVATPFEHESYGDTLLKCQRYFELCGFISRTDNLLDAVDYKVEKRAQSSIAVVSSDASGFSVSVNEHRDSRQGFYQSANASHTTRVTMSSDAEL